MEYVISLVLGGLASHMQAGRLKALPKWARYAMSMVASVVVAVFASYIENLDTGGWNWDQTLKNMGTAFMTSQTYYQTYFKSKLNASKNT